MAEQEWFTVEDLPEPDRSYPVTITVTSVYTVWVEDYSSRGQKGLVKYLNEDPSDMGDLIRHESAYDGEIVAAVPDAWDLRDGLASLEHGPWQLCPFAGCQVVQYPWYGADPACLEHRVIGCQQRNLPTIEPGEVLCV